MEYGQIEFAQFLDRPNRFVAHVRQNDEDVTVHVKNTGRCRELLVPGCRVVLERASNPQRKTPYDLVGVFKQRTDHPDGWLFNIDSQAPNKVVAEWLAGQDYDLVKPEYTLGDSRFDFMMERAGKRYLMEVKGCTLEIDGVGYFPDAPTERGVKHLRELTQLASQGWNCMVAFVFGMAGVTEVRPNMATHPAFGQALADAQLAGVRVFALSCAVYPKGMVAIKACDQLDLARWVHNSDPQKDTSDPKSSRGLRTNEGRK